MWARRRTMNDPGLKVTHARLQRAEQEVQSLWSQLMGLRRNFADTKQSGV